MNTETIFNGLKADLQEQVRDCDNGVVYVGATSLGENTYFFHLMGENGGEGYLSLPVAPEGEEYPRIEWMDLVIQVGQKYFDLEGKEFFPSPFRLLIHVDLRKWDLVYEENAPYTDPYHEKSILLACGGGSTLPVRAAKAAGVDPKDSVPWAINYWIGPDELSDELREACVAITKVFPDRRREIVL